jgi:hypothetical protein
LITDGPYVRAVTIPSGSLDLVGVDVTLVVDDAVASAEQWTLFSLERPDSLRIEQATVTLANPRPRPAAIIELRPVPGAMMPDMPAAGTQPRRPLQVEIVQSLIRGTGDLFLIRQSEPARLGVRQSVIALQGALLAGRDQAEPSSDVMAQLELQLEHVTAVLSGGLIRLDSGSTPRKLLPVQVSASNCIFSNSGGTPLVSMTGNQPPQDFRTLLLWIGRNNFYDRYQTYWSIVSSEGTGRSVTLDFSTWRKNWTDASEANPRESVVWQKRAWMNRPFAELTPSDFALDRQAPNNAAVSGATNSADAGAGLAGLRGPAPTTPVDAGERTTSQGSVP